MTLPNLEGVKIGCWAKGEPSLRQLHHGLYGELTLTIWQTDDMLVTLQMLQSFLWKYHIRKDIYDVECYGNVIRMVLHDVSRGCMLPSP